MYLHQVLLPVKVQFFTLLINKDETIMDNIARDVMGVRQTSAGGSLFHVEHVD